MNEKSLRWWLNVELIDADIDRPMFLSAALTVNSTIQSCWQVSVVLFFPFIEKLRALRNFGPAARCLPKPSDQILRASWQSLSSSLPAMPVKCTRIRLSIAFKNVEAGPLHLNATASAKSLSLLLVFADEQERARASANLKVSHPVRDPTALLQAIKSGCGSESAMFAPEVLVVKDRIGTCLAQFSFNEDQGVGGY